VRPATHQVEDLLSEVRIRAERTERVLVTTLTKRMAEDLTEYYAEVGVRVRYLHADIDTIERSAILRDLRRGDFDVLVGINLLREGLDLPEVSLVAILDADKEGYLRSATALIQTTGRAARNVAGKVIMYADRVTASMRQAIEETNRRREKQRAYNEAHGITPETVRRAIHDLSPLEAAMQSAGARFGTMERLADEAGLPVPEAALGETIARLEREMREAAKALEFERAAVLRDEIRSLKDRDLGLGGKGDLDDVLSLAREVEREARGPKRRGGRGRASRRYRGGKP